MEGLREFCYRGLVVEVNLRGLMALVKNLGGFCFPQQSILHLSIRTNSTLRLSLCLVLLG